MIEGQFAAVAAVHAARPALEQAALAIEERLRAGGRLVYAGAGTSGRLAVPTLVGETVDQAKSSLQVAGLKPGNTIKQSSTSFASGRIISSSPDAGTSVQIGSQVTLFVSTGPPPVQVPDVTGEDVGQAKSTLQSRGFNVDTTEQVTSSSSPGTVLSQNPSGGKTVANGSTVTLTVAKAPATVAVPNVVGKTTGQADATLGAAGFPAVPQQQTVSDKTQNGLVLTQTPAAGSQAKKGANVTIVVGKYVAPTPTTTTTTTTPTTTTTTTPTGTTSTPKKKK